MYHKVIGRMNRTSIAGKDLYQHMNTTIDPRAQRSRARILEAVRTILLTEGPEAVTHQRVADVAGVGRATVYRHWTSSDDMVYALLDENPFQLLDAPPDTPLDERLAGWLAWVTELLSDPQRRSVILHVLSRTESDARASRLRSKRISELVVHLDTAIGDTGCWQQLPPARKVDGVTLLVGPLLMRVLMLSTAPSRATVDEVVHRFLVWLEAESVTMQDATR